MGNFLDWLGSGKTAPTLVWIAALGAGGYVMWSRMHLKTAKPSTPAAGLPIFGAR